VGFRYHAGNAGIGDLHGLPSPIRATYNSLIHDRQQRERGLIRSKNDRTFDQRALHFGEWCLAKGFTDESLRDLPQGKEIAVLASYIFTVACEENSLRGAKQRAQVKQPPKKPTPLQTKTIVNYLSSAHAFLEAFLQRRFSIADPRGQGIHPLVADILNDRRKWQQSREKREPYTNEMFAYLHRRVQQQGKQNRAAFLDLLTTVFDWTSLGIFIGSRANEYAQSTAKKGTFSRVPRNNDAGQWADSPIAFIPSDFTYYTEGKVLVPHSQLSRKSHLVHEVHVRFRYDKSPQNFTIRKFRQSGHPFLCPIRSSIAIIMRASILTKLNPMKPLGVYRTDTKGNYTYLQSRDIIKVMRSAVDGAYPDPNHFLRLHKERIVAHSNRVTAAVALANAGMSIEQIAFRLRWSPPSVQHYLRETSMQVDLLTKNAIRGAQII
jgi:hypothetical protein